MWDQNALGYVISKITLIPYFIENQSFRYYKIIYIFENGIAYCSALGNYFVIYIHHKIFFRGWKESEGLCNNFSVAAGKLTIFQRRILVYYKYTYK